MSPYDMTTDDIVELLYDYYLRYKDRRYMIQYTCPFTVDNKKECQILCWSFSQLSSYKCPCSAFGQNEAFIRLKDVLREYHYELEEV